jgi:hypothetical protein
MTSSSSRSANDGPNLAAVFVPVVDGLLLLFLLSASGIRCSESKNVGKGIGEDLVKGGRGHIWRMDLLVE